MDNFTLTSSCYLVSHNASCTALPTFPVLSDETLSSHTHTQLQNYQCYIRMSLGLRFFLHSALGAVEDTGAPGPPLPADVGNRDTVGGARQRLAAAAGVRAGWICHLFFMNLRRNWGKKRANKSIFPGSHNFFMLDTGLFIIDSCNVFTLLLLSFVRFSN